MNQNETREIISFVPTVADLPTLSAEISILARELRAASFGAITNREAIERARGILGAAAQMAEAA